MSSASSASNLNPADPPARRNALCGNPPLRAKGLVRYCAPTKRACASSKRRAHCLPQTYPSLKSTHAELSICAPWLRSSAAPLFCAASKGSEMETDGEKQT
eukprot:5947875-Pleurochrysis_carterae.AAC.1